MQAPAKGGGQERLKKGALNELSHGQEWGKPGTEEKWINGVKGKGKEKGKNRETKMR